MKRTSLQPLQVPWAVESGTPNLLARLDEAGTAEIEVGERLQR